MKPQRDIIIGYKDEGGVSEPPEKDKSIDHKAFFQRYRDKIMKMVFDHKGIESGQVHLDEFVGSVAGYICNELQEKDSKIKDLDSKLLDYAINICPMKDAEIEERDIKIRELRESLKTREMEIDALRDHIKHIEPT